MTKALILVGGFGTRLQPVTYALPKAMVPVANRPLLERVLWRLAQGNVRDVLLAVCYRPDAIRDYFGDGTALGVALEYVVEEQPLGTGGAVSNCAPLLDGTFIVVNGDILTSMDVAQMLDFHRRSKALATISVQRVQDPSRYGVVQADAALRVTRFIEKPAPGTMRDEYINAGIYIFESAALDEMPPPPFSMERDFFPGLLDKGRPVFAFPIEGYWADVGTAESYRQVHRDILDGELRVPLDGIERRPGVRVGEGTEIARDAAITAPVMMGRRCTIADGASIGPHCVLADDVLVEAGARISDSVVWRGCTVGAGASLQGCIIANDSKISANAVLAGQAVAEQAGGNGR